MELEQIAKEYAKNRESLRAVKIQIKTLLENTSPAKSWEEDKIDLSEYRLDWLRRGCQWNGWICAVCNHPDDCVPVESPEYKLAELLDEKARLRSEVGQIKRNLYHAGNRLLKVK